MLIMLLRRRIKELDEDEEEAEDQSVKSLCDKPHREACNSNRCIEARWVLFSALLVVAAAVRSTPQMAQSVLGEGRMLCSRYG